MMKKRYTKYSFTLIQDDYDDEEGEPDGKNNLLGKRGRGDDDSDGGAQSQKKRPNK